MCVRAGTVCACRWQRVESTHARERERERETAAAAAGARANTHKKRATERARSAPSLMSSTTTSMSGQLWAMTAIVGLRVRDESEALGAWCVCEQVWAAGAAPRVLLRQFGWRAIERRAARRARAPSSGA